AQSATEIREASGRANAERASRPDSATASMRSSSGSHHTRSLGRFRRQKGWDSGTNDSWARGIADWLFNPEPDLPNHESSTETDEPSTTTDDKPDEPSTAAADEPSTTTDDKKPDEPSTTADKPDESK
ncbi:MAG: hypothetical protein P8104_12330, partial [Gammaproteobacteria bacterium]